ncbi:MAG: hypothetical protein PHV07_02650 [Oscillospiraceae bacterium]|nr:hypothetical protein [Oscillospiraceae bacterium]
MKKWFLSMLFALCIAVTLQPVSVMAEPSPQARWGILSEGDEIPTDWISSGNLIDAVSAANSSPNSTVYIQLLSDVSTTELTLTTNNATILDLNSKTLISSSSNVICHYGLGKLTITDSTSEKNGKVTCQAPESDTIVLYGGSLAIECGTVENTGIGFTINNCSIGSVEITGGTVSSTGVATIINQFVGSLNVSGGVVKARDGIAIYIFGSGKTTISGTAKITSANTNSKYGTIFISYFRDQGTDTVLEIKGGLIENTANNGNAINNSSTYTVDISGGIVNATGVNGVGICVLRRNDSIVISSGTPIIKGRGMAMSAIPVLSTDIQLSASTDYDGDLLADYKLRLLFTYDMNNYTFIIYNYKYFRFGPSTAVARIGKKFYTDLQEAFDQGESGSTIQLMNNIELRQPIFNDKGKTFTLDLNGKTISGGSTIIQNNWGTLTITDNSDGKKGIVKGGGYETILNRSKLIIAGGTVSSSENSMCTIDNQLSGTVNIVGGTVNSSGNNSYTIFIAYYMGIVDVSGGTVSASGDNSIAIYTRNASTISVSGGTVSASGNGSIAIRHMGNKAVIISGGTVSSDLFNAILTTRSIVISSGSPIIKGGSVAINIAPSFDNTVLMVAASNSFDGRTSVTYDTSKIGTYKYLEFWLIPVSVDDTQCGGIESSAHESNISTVDNDPNVPPTGDGSKLLPLVLLMITALYGMGAAVCKKKHTLV